MIFDRQKRLLALLDALGGEVGNMDFQKLLFLYCREVDPAHPYDFVPYRFGGFSFTSYADKRKLTEHGMLSNVDKTWVLTKEGRTAAKLDSSVSRHLMDFVRRYSSLRGDSLVAEAYRRYPYYATRSEVAARLLQDDPRALAAIQAARPAAGKPGLCTIGYEGHSLESYLNRLLQEGVTLLCDVRRNPLSRKYGFSKKTLAKGCEGVGIRYEHLPELGIASEERRELNTQADYDALFAVYERKSLPLQTEYIETIRTWITKGERVALTCFEHLPHQCHRHCVAEVVERRFGNGLTAVHL